MEEKILQVLQKSGAGSPVRRLTKLHGDASYRVYYRAELENGETRVVMQMPAGKSSASEEITNFQGRHDEPPFIGVQRFLETLGLPVPKVYHYAEDEKIIILEDLGDDMFIKFVQNAGDKTRIAWYKKAIDLLARLQEKTAGADKSASVALNRSFDATLLNWEFDHFREYLIEERLGEGMAAADRRVFEEETRKITAEILKIPYCFTHRDFQSRNLMVKKDGSLAMIDFQDALMGPCVYDLAALLRDSYVELPWELVEELIDYAKSDASQFHLVTIQRKMKDAGRFVYIDRVKNNQNFLQYIPVTLGYVKNAFDRLATPQTRRLAGLLKKYVPEWQ